MTTRPPHTLPPKPLPFPVDSHNGGHRPNYLIFMPDQLRYDALGCTTPDSGIRTPNIDAFRQRGTLLTNCFTQASVCSQSRCSIFTGNYPHVSGHRSLNNLIKPWEPNVLRSLKEAGYHVACLAPRGDTFAPTVTELSVSEYGFLETPEFAPKFVTGPDGKPYGSSGMAGPAPASASPSGTQEEGPSIWDRLFYKGLRNASEAVDYDEAVVRSALSWLECPPDDKPWLLLMPLLFPHCPFQVEEPYFSLYDRTEPCLARAPQDRTGYEPRYMQVIRKRYGTARASDDVWREVKATYYGMVARLDSQFGRVIGKLDELGLWKDTVTFFFTDHGEYMGDHGLIEKWPSGLSDSLTHEPLIVAGAGLPEGVAVDAMAEMVDLVPTLLEMSGVGEHFPHGGRSWVPLLQGGTEHKKYAFTEGGFLKDEEPLLEQAPYPYDIKSSLQHEDTTLVGKAVAVRDGTWTFVYRLYEPAELYHRGNDPHELHNLAAEPEYKAVADMFESATFRWLFAGSDYLPWQNDPRWPEVKLKTPREQMDERLARRAG